MSARAILATAAAVIAWCAVAAAPAGAHPSPPGCLQTSLDVQLAKDRLVVRPGDTMNWSVLVNNNAGLPCDLTNVNVALTLPGLDGRASGTIVPLENGGSYPAGLANRTYPVIPWTVAVNPGVTSAVAAINGAGILHDADPDQSATIFKDLRVIITQPSATLTATVTPTSGTSPLSVTYTYTLTNTSTTTAPISSPVVSDDRCDSIQLTGGDANGNGLLDVGETWTYTCAEIFTSPGVFPGTVTATGTNTVDLRPVPIAPATTNVTVARPTQGAQTPGGDGDDTPTRQEILRRPLPSPNSPSARRDAECVAVPTTLPVRARELTRVTVRVRRRGRAVRQALVQITGPGIRRRALTNSRGIAVIRVRARRSGQLVIQTDQCAGADRVRVRAARRTVSQDVPRNTG